MLNPYRGFLLSRVRIPPSPQASADLCGVNTTESAWAAGFFDAEGSVLVRDRRGALRRELAVSQAGRGAAPSVLVRFQAACDGRGTVRGPRRGYLYYWRVSSKEDVDAVGALIVPWLSDPKRTQLLSAGDRTGRPVSSPRHGPIDRDHELAWAAGFFGGDGTVGASRSNSDSPARHIRARIAQAGPSGKPEVLTRFLRAVNGIGGIRGPFMPKNPWSRQVQYAWQVGGSLAVESVLESLWPWLHDVKRTQALHAIVAARANGPHRPMRPPSAIFGLG